MITKLGSKALGWMLLGLLLLITRGQVAAQKLEKMRVGYNAITGSNSALWISKEAGFTAKNGLDVDFIYIESGSRITQAMVAGDLRLGNTGSGPSIQAHAKGADTVLILSVMPTLPFQVVARPEIKKPEDLRGKKLAISTFGSTTDFAARYFLEKTGLAAGKDVTVLQSGGQSTRLAALKQGAVDATLLGAPTLLVAKQFGLHILADLVDMGFHYDFGSIATTRSFINSNRDAVRRFVRAYVEGVHYFKTHADESKKIMARYLRENEPTVLEETYSYYADKTASTPYPTREGIEPVISQVIAGSKAEKTKLTFEDVADQSFVRELDRSGFIQSLYRK
jgi:NitT/TauT family transport system substrate-binding protein